MRIIITGGTGMIGTALSEKLVASGHDVHVLSRNPDNYKGRLPAGVNAHQWDAKTSDGWLDLANGADAIVNLAGASIAGGSPAYRWTDARKKVILDSRVNAGNAVMDAISKATDKPKALIQASAIGYYGSRNENKLTETAKPTDEFISDVVQKWEQSTVSAETQGVRRVVYRIGVVLSCEGGALPLITLPFKFMVGGPLGDGQQWFSWVHIDDVVNALHAAIEDARYSGTYNVTAPSPVTNATLANKVGLVMGRPALLPAPGPALRLILGEMSTTVLDGARVMPERLKHQGFQFRFTEIETALRDLLATPIGEK